MRQQKTIRATLDATAGYKPSEKKSAHAAASHGPCTIGCMKQVTNTEAKMKKQTTTPQLTITKVHAVENERKNKWAPPKRSKLTVHVDGYRGATDDTWETMPRREHFESAPSAMGIKFFDKAGYKAAMAAWDKECNANHRAWVREITPLVQRAIADKYDFVTGVKIHWSRTAGCCCGCTPGFKADLTTTETLFVTIHSPESLAAEQAKEAANAMLTADKEAEKAEAAATAQVTSFDACI